MHLTPVLNFKIKILVLLSLGEILLTLYSCWLNWNFIITKYHLSTTRLIDDSINYKIGFFHYQKPNVISLKNRLHFGKSGNRSVGGDFLRE